MGEATVRYDAEKNTVYVVADEVYQGAQYMIGSNKWKAEVKDKGLKDYNTIIDMSKVDLSKFKPSRLEESGDVAWRDYTYEAEATRRDGNGKVVVVISRSKGGCPTFERFYSPDATVLSIEDAEEYIATGMLYDRM